MLYRNRRGHDGRWSRGDIKRRWDEMTKAGAAEACWAEAGRAATAEAPEVGVRWEDAE